MRKEKENREGELEREWRKRGGERAVEKKHCGNIKGRVREEKVRKIIEKDVQRNNRNLKE